MDLCVCAAVWGPCPALSTLTRPTSSSHWGERLYCVVCGLVVWMGLSAFPRGLVSRRGGCVYSYAGHGRWCVPCFGGSAFVPVWESEMSHLKGWQCLGWWDWVIRNPICFKRLWKVIQPSPWFLHPQPQRSITITHIPEGPHCPETIAQQQSLAALFGPYVYACIFGVNKGASVGECVIYVVCQESFCQCFSVLFSLASCSPVNKSSRVPVSLSRSPLTQAQIETFSCLVFCILSFFSVQSAQTNHYLVNTVDIDTSTAKAWH